MNRIFSVFAILCILFSLAGCSLSDEPIKEKNDAGVSSSEPEQAKTNDFGLNETAAFKNLKFTATDILESNGKDFFEPEDGKVFVGIKFTIENISNETQSVSSILLFDAYADDAKCEYSLSANCVFSDGTLDGDIAAGKKLVGWYALEVPQDWHSIDLDVKSSWLSDSSARFVFKK